MDKKEIAVLLLSSAVIGAAFSAIITALNSWRERVARRRELVLHASLDLTKAFMARVDAPKQLSAAYEVFAFDKVHGMVGRIFKDGKIPPRELAATVEMDDLDAIMRWANERKEPAVPSKERMETEAESSSGEGRSE